MQAQDFSKLEHLVTFYSQANNGLPCELRQPAMAPQDRDSITDDETGEIRQGSQIHQHCSDDSTEVMEGVTSTPEIFGNIVLSLPFSQQIQFTLIVNVVNLN